MGINRRKQSKEISKGLLTFSASVGMEKLIFPPSHTEGTIALCFLRHLPQEADWGADSMVWCLCVVGALGSSPCGNVGCV